MAKNHRAMECEECGTWFHIKCCGVTPKQYLDYKTKTNLLDLWQCPFMCTLALSGPSVNDGCNSDITDDNDSTSSSSCLNLSESSESHEQSFTNELQAQSLTNTQTTFEGVKITSINVDSIKGRSKAGLLKSFIETSPSDIFIMSETYLPSTAVDSDFLPSGYNSIRDPYCLGKRGVLIAHKANLIMSKIDLPDNTCELVLARLKLVGKPDIIVGSFYRHCNSHTNSLRSLQNNLRNLFQKEHLPNIIIAGDFNLPGINWGLKELIPSPQYGIEVNNIALDITNEFSLTQVVQEPTRGRNNLDIVLTSSPDLIRNVIIGPGISDHDSVTVDFNFRASVSHKKRRKVFIFQKADTTKLQSEIAKLKESFIEEAHSHSVDDNWINFTTSLLKIVKQCVPQKEIKGRQGLPWLDHSLRRKIHKKNKLHAKYKKSTSLDIKQKRWDAYLKLQKEVRTDINNAYDKYMNTLFETDSRPNKRFWTSIKAKRRDQVSIPPLRNGNSMVSTSKEKAEVLNNQYQSVFVKEDLENIPNKGQSPYNSLPHIEVTTNGVQCLLNKLDPKKAIGPDGIPTAVLRDYSEEIAPMLQMIFQQSLDTGEVPDDWKQANICAIFKKGDKHNAANYRPVSLTCVSCKVLEHIIFRSIMDHLDNNNILVNFQHGFRALHSCETQLVNTIQDLAKGIDDQEQLDLLILDFSKAFDTVAHRRLLDKLQYYGIRDTIHTWLKNWLTGRVQRVVVDGEFSSVCSVMSGVPQGTVLGPLMFILYINDISEGTESSIRLFADDCILYRVIGGAGDAEVLQSDLDRLCKWAEKWQMSFNTNKCSVLSVTKKRNPLVNLYNMQGSSLQHCDQHPYLGVQLTKEMCWGPHIHKTTAKAQVSLDLLRRNMSGCSTETKALAYNSIVRPVLEYAGAVWDPYHITHIHKLEAVQRRAARWALQDYQREASVTAMLEELGWRTLQERRCISRLVFFYKTRIQKTACHIPSSFRPIVPLYASRLSNSCQHTMPHTRSDIYRLSFFPRTVRIWNILPEELIASTTHQMFKTRLQQMFLDGSLYMVPPKDQTQTPRLGGMVSQVGATF